MKRVFLLALCIQILFGMELWKQRYYLDKELFHKQMAILQHQNFLDEKFDFFQSTAQKLNFLRELKAIKSAKSLEAFLKAKAKLIVKLESNAYDKKMFDLIDMLDFDEDVKKEILFAKKIKKLFIALEKSDLKINQKPLEKLFFIKEYFTVLGKNIDISKLEKAIKEKDKDAFKKGLVALQKEILLLKSKKLSPKELQANVKSFIRYNKLTAFDYSNGIDDEGNIKNNLEYTEAVIFSARAKEKILALSSNINQEDFQKLLAIYEKIISNIEKKKNKKEVKTLTKEAKKIVLTATGVKDIRETPKEIVSHINSSLDAMLKMAKENNFKQADFFRLEAYSFFDPDIEVRLKPRDPALATEIEGLFWDGFGDIKGLGYELAHKDIKNLPKTIAILKEKLQQAQIELESKLSYANSMFQSMMIIIREGLEAVLVLAVLLTLFNSKRDKIFLFGGVALGAFASIATYYVAKEIISISTSNRELIEGGSALLAAIMLIFVTAWIFHNTYVKGWVAYTKELSEKSIKTGSVVTLLFIGFLVVYREGFETVLFYEALAHDSYPQAVWIGFVIGLAVIIVVAVLLIKGIKKLPINLIFKITGFLLSILAVIFVGAGIRGLQTANIISATPSIFLPNWQFLRDYFGYSPTIETAAAQIGVALLLLGLYLLSRYKKPSRL
ncbi:MULTISPECIES: FTR1 family protein [unclassified Nitratiruptor]|uniref:FTR1 family iron permease n=1 Tax=unclassified Nitratiruptor TaxID=2624044 RepID=UPI0018ED0063|nr:MULTISPECIES: FTR1 family protein [unclassified Nitratiruptor]BCD61158.1 cytochrome c [Nitratiruptor sp. YY08-10]BCD65091.1 cytochrome c [Nitratiruptor sp. YY08-14]